MLTFNWFIQLTSFISKSLSLISSFWWFSSRITFPNWSEFFFRSFVDKRGRSGTSWKKSPATNVLSSDEWDDEDAKCVRACVRVCERERERESESEWTREQIAKAREREAGLIGKGERGMERGNLKSVIMGEREREKVCVCQTERERETKA